MCIISLSEAFCYFTLVREPLLSFTLDSSSSQTWKSSQSAGVPLSTTSSCTDSPTRMHIFIFSLSCTLSLSALLSSIFFKTFHISLLFSNGLRAIYESVVEGVSRWASQAQGQLTAVGATVARVNNRQIERCGAAADHFNWRFSDLRTNADTLSGRTSSSKPIIECEKAGSGICLNVSFRKLLLPREKEKKI